MSVSDGVGDGDYARGMMVCVAFFITYGLVFVFSSGGELVLAKSAAVMGAGAFSLFFGLIKMRIWAHYALLVLCGFTVLGTSVSTDQWMPWSSVGTLVFPVLALYVEPLSYSIKVLLGYASIVCIIYGAPEYFGVEGIGLSDRVGVITGVALASLGVGIHKRSLADSRVLYEQLTMIDRVTGLLNGTGLRQRVADEIMRSRREESSLVVVNCNLMNFNAINRQYGRDIGDAVLGYFGNLLKTLCRGTDVIGRMESDDFYILLPNTTAVSASQLLDRIVRGFGEGKLVVKGKIVSMKMHIGLAAKVHSDGLSADDILMQARSSMMKMRKMQSQMIG